VRRHYPEQFPRYNLKTEDGPKTSAPFYNGANSTEISKFIFLDSLTSLLRKRTGIIDTVNLIKTVDGGKNWIDSKLNYKDELYQIYFTVEFLYM
jgi:hypothetical protein